MRSRLSLISMLAALLLLAACRPLYLPPLIDGAEPEERARLLLELRLADENRPLLSVEVLSVVQDGWLAIQWFSPGGTEVASASIWLDQESVGLTHLEPLPEDISGQSGEWRVLLSQHSRVIRQLTVTVP